MSNDERLPDWDCKAGSPGRLADGYALKGDKRGLRLLYQGEEIAQPFCWGYAVRVINQHRPPGRSSQ